MTVFGAVCFLGAIAIAAAVLLLARLGPGNMGRIELALTDRLVQGSSTALVM